MVVSSNGSYSYTRFPYSLSRVSTSYLGEEEDRLLDSTEWRFRSDEHYKNYNYWMHEVYFYCFVELDNLFEESVNGWIYSNL